MSVFLYPGVRASCVAQRQGFEKKALCEYGLGVPGRGWAPAWEALQPDSQRPAPSSSGLRPSFATLLLLSATWLLALLSVNSDTLLFHYLFAASNCVQVPARGPALVGGAEFLCGERD